MNDFYRKNWMSYLFPVGGPLLVFLVSFFATNIGWRAFPIGIVVCACMVHLTTLKLRRHERDVERLINAIKAAGTVKVIQK